MRLLSYNIHKGIGGRDRRYRLERIIQVIQAEDPDFDLPSGGRSPPGPIAARRPAAGSSARRCEATAHLYQSNVRLKNGGYGNLVLSRWPFRECQQISLRRKRRKPRGAQMAVVETPEGPDPSGATGISAWPSASGTGRFATCSTTRSSASRLTCRR